MGDVVMIFNFELLTLIHIPDGAVVSSILEHHWPAAMCEQVANPQLN